MVRAGGKVRKREKNAQKLKGGREEMKGRHNKKVWVVWRCVLVWEAGRHWALMCRSMVPPSAHSRAIHACHRRLV
jgi:hypothetical protein